MSSSRVVAVVFKVLVRRQIVKYLETKHNIPYKTKCPGGYHLQEVNGCLLLTMNILFIQMN